MLKLAIDLGTATTKIYKIGSGIVLSEPTCVAVNADTQQVKAIGNAAKLLVGKTAEATSIIFPVFEGEIVNHKMTVALLDGFLKKIGVRGSRGRVEALFAVPCGMPQQSKLALYNVCDDLGISHIDFVEVPYLSALGQDAPVSDSTPVFIMDVGAGTTNIAVTSLDSVIAGISVNIGGSNMDAHIIDYVAERFALKIGSLTGERLKNTIGSLVEGDHQTMIITGRDLQTGMPRSVSVDASEILYPIRIYVDKLIEYAGMILQKLPADVSRDVGKNGILLSGGVVNIVGFADYVSERLFMEARVCEEPQMAVVLGGGRAVGDPALLKKIRQEF